MSRSEDSDSKNQDSPQSLNPVIEQALREAVDLAALEVGSVEELEETLDRESALCESISLLPYDALTEKLIGQLKVRFFGKKSIFQTLLTGLRNLPADKRKESGARINAAKKSAESLLGDYFERCLLDIEHRTLLADKSDLTLPHQGVHFGSRHPVSVVARDLAAPLQRMGFVVVDGPELELDFFNFEALNMPPEHSAREMQDTFFLPPQRHSKTGRENETRPSWVMRTHTSSVQVHALLERGAPLRIACPGYTYRNEYDLTHVPTFRQIEGLVVDYGIHFGHLRHTLATFFNEVFGRPVKMRFRSSYFPFTEPSAEMDVQCQQCFGEGCRACKHTGWLEMGGCGLVHRKVLEACKVPEGMKGFAFGMGVDRIAMSKFGIADLRALTEGDVDYLSCFNLT